MRIFPNLLTALSLALVAPAAAVTVKSVDFAVTLAGKSPNKNLVLNGVGLRQKTVFNVDVYVAGLYVEKRSDKFQEVIDSPTYRRIELIFLRDVEAKDIVGSWNEGFDRYCGTQCQELRPLLDRLNGLMTDVKKFTRIVFDFHPDRFVLTSAGMEPQTFADAAFSKIAISSFIGKYPPSEALRDGMLGLPGKNLAAAK